MRSHISQLPTDILKYTFTFFNKFEVVNVSCVSKQFNAIVKIINEKLPTPELDFKNYTMKELNFSANPMALVVSDDNIICSFNDGQMQKIETSLSADYRVNLPRKKSYVAKKLTLFNQEVIGLCRESCCQDTLFKIDKKTLAAKQINTNFFRYCKITAITILNNNIIIGYEAGQIGVFNFDGQIVKELRSANQNPIIALLALPNNYFVSSSKTMEVWHVEDMKPKFSYIEYHYVTTSFTLLSAQEFASGTNFGSLHIWNMQDNNFELKLRIQYQHFQAIKSMTTLNADTFASLSNDLLSICQKGALIKKIPMNQFKNVSQLNTLKYGDLLLMSENKLTLFKFKFFESQKKAPQSMENKEVIKIASNM